MQPRVDRHRLTFVLLPWIGGATVCFAQDVDDESLLPAKKIYAANGSFS